MVIATAGKPRLDLVMVGLLMNVGLLMDAGLLMGG
jgi:hypothetical protein